MKACNVVMITQDEEETLPFVLETLRPLTEIIGRIVIVDGGSTDDTLSIIRRYTAEMPITLYSRPFDNFRDQKNYALKIADHPSYPAEWILTLDADHVFNSLTFYRLMQNGFFNSNEVWDFDLRYCKGDLLHYDAPSYQGMPTTRMWRAGLGIRYMRAVHEYPVYPDDPSWDSIRRYTHQLSTTDKICIFEMRMLKSRKSLLHWIDRYQQFSEGFKEAGTGIPPYSYVYDLCADRFAGAAQFPQPLLIGVPQSVFALPIPWQNPLFGEDQPQLKEKQW